MKQTAVEWLVEQLKTMDTKSFNRLIQIEMSRENFEECFEQAKAMEKEQKIAFGKKCFYKGFEKAENDDANCFTAWREEAPELLTFKSE